MPNLGLLQNRTFLQFLKNLQGFRQLILLLKIEKAQRTERMTKNRIAMDLHNEVGTILTRML